MNKRGVFYLIDALVAVSIVIVTLVLALNFSEKHQEDLNFELDVLDSFMNALIKSQIHDIDNDYVQRLVGQRIIEPEATPFIAIADLYRRGQAGQLSPQYAENLTRELSKLVTHQNQYGFYYKINNTILYEKDMSKIAMSKKRVTLTKVTFFKYNDSGDTKLFGPTNTEASLWIT